MDTQTRIDTWRRLLDDPRKCWVLFEHGTCVVLTAPSTDDPAGQATAILREFGPVRAGGPAGDFSLNPPPAEAGGFLAHVGWRPAVRQLLHDQHQPGGDQPGLTKQIQEVHVPSWLSISTVYALLGSRNAQQSA